MILGFLSFQIITLLFCLKVGFEGVAINVQLPEAAMMTKKKKKGADKVDVTSYIVLPFCSRLRL